MKSSSRAARTAPKIARRIEADEVCELLVAELEGRRERLRHLLRLVMLEAKRNSSTRAAAPDRPKCKRPGRSMAQI
jgi:hypothetical protein